MTKFLLCYIGHRERLQPRKKKYRTSSDTLKLQRLIEYLKQTGSEAGTKLDESAKDYINKVQVCEISRLSSY